MKKKIIITGGLGYIGTELCKLYSGISWHHEVTVLDNRFISERVNQLRNWNIDFIHGDILDKDLVKKQFHNADVVHHLAGITNVPRTERDASAELDSKIKLDYNFNELIEKNKNVDIFEFKCLFCKMGEELIKYRNFYYINIDFYLYIFKYKK